MNIFQQTRSLNNQLFSLDTVMKSVFLTIHSNGFLVLDSWYKTVSQRDLKIYTSARLV